MPGSTAAFWDALAPHHAAIENNYLDPRSVRRIMPEILGRVLVVGAGQGLIVEELQRNGFECDGLDFSAQMVQHARERRGLNLVRGDARALPFADGAYGTILYATGVVDFIGDESQIRQIIAEGRRVARESGRLFAAFYRMSAVLEDYLAQTGLLTNNVLEHRRTLETYFLTPFQMTKWLARQTGGYLQAVVLLLRVAAFSTMKEKTASWQMQKIFKKINDPDSLIKSAEEHLPYRNEAEIRNLLNRLATPIKRFETTPTCYIAQIQ